MPLDVTLYSQVQHAHPGLQVLHGKFTMVDAAAPSAAEGRPFAVDGSDIVRNGLGDFTLTVPGVGGLDILCVHLSVSDATNTLSVQAGAISEANRTIDIAFSDLATPTADDPSTGAFLFVTIVLKSRQI